MCMRPEHIFYHIYYVINEAKLNKEKSETFNVAESDFNFIWFCLFYFHVKLRRVEDPFTRNCWFYSHGNQRHHHQYGDANDNLNKGDKVEDPFIRNWIRSEKWLEVDQHYKEEGIANIKGGVLKMCKNWLKTFFNAAS